MVETDTITEQLSEAPRELCPSIKLIKNSKKYNWEIKVLSLDVDMIEKLNTDMMKRFGSLEG